MEVTKMPHGYVRLNDLAAYLGTGVYAARKFGASIGAERKVGKLLVYDLAIVKNALDTQKTEAPAMKEG